MADLWEATWADSMVASMVVTSAARRVASMAGYSAGSKAVKLVVTRVASMVGYSADL